jgi:hypothetical protein
VKEATLTLPVTLELLDTTVGEEGIFGWVVELTKGRAGRIEVPALNGKQDLRKLAAIFQTLSMASELACSASLLTGKGAVAADLAAEVTGEHPLEDAARAGKARCCMSDGCGHLWDVRSQKTAEGGGQGTCKLCGALYEVNEARKRAEDALGVKRDPDYGKKEPAKPKEEGINAWF